MNMRRITAQVVVNAPITRVWECWTKPEHIIQWAFASDDWEAPTAENDLRIDGKFKTVMAAKDGSSSFDFIGTYSVIKKHERIEYDMDDRRHVTVIFGETPEDVRVTETFDPESENPEEMQRAGWQAILENFKKYVEKI
jgi:uncharacterized protein YndB with AHSA1/START domain